MEAILSEILHRIEEFLGELMDISAEEREVIKDRISKLAFFPLAHLDVQKLRGYENVYRLRVGEYRSSLNIRWTRGSSGF